uniref:Uncharacterized protein n=1 Tax=Anguilla anguilla TaxID=7936 RepID=A0A0E9Q0U9_ANGAN
MVVGEVVVTGSRSSSTQNLLYC